VKQSGTRAGRFERSLEAACKALALAGGAILALIALMSVASIGGGSLNRPIQGDFERVQFGCAVAVLVAFPALSLWLVKLIT